MEWWSGGVVERWIGRAVKRRSEGEEERVSGGDKKGWNGEAERRSGGGVDR